MHLSLWLYETLQKCLIRHLIVPPVAVPHRPGHPRQILGPHRVPSVREDQPLRPPVHLSGTESAGNCDALLPYVPGRAVLKATGEFRSDHAPNRVVYGCSFLREENEEVKKYTQL